MTRRLRSDGMGIKSLMLQVVVTYPFMYKQATAVVYIVYDRLSGSMPATKGYASFLHRKCLPDPLVLVLQCLCEHLYDTCLSKFLSNVRRMAHQ